MKVIGLMSGTSADGVDAALCEVSGQPPHLTATIAHAITHAYPDGMQAQILAGCLPAESRVDTLAELHAQLGEQLALAALEVLEQADVASDEVALIGSHGQTVWHGVQPDGRVSATLQIGEASIIAERTGITTVSNFRPRDVAAGGQGAPLTSYLDWLLLRHPTHWRAVQNIGGIGNVTFLPPLMDNASTPLAFDTGPGNALMDAAAVTLTAGAMAYDTNGALAAKGQVDGTWLEELLNHPYFERALPKTTGRELFGAPLALELVRDGQRRGLEAASILATLTALTAYSIADAYQRFAPAPIGEVIVGGGGQRNPTLMHLLAQVLQPTKLLTHEDIGMDSKNKEALVFAVLAYETWHGRTGNLPVLTGATHPAVLGQITPGNNFAAFARATWCAKAMEVMESQS